MSPSVLHDMLVGYDCDLHHYLVHGFSHGFCIGCFGLPPQPEVHKGNLQSAEEYSGVIDAKIAKELASGRVLGPFDVSPSMPNYRVSPLGVVPKKTPGEFRMIHHLSHPEGSSVNDFIPKDMSSVHYATIQDAIDFIKDSPKPVYMAKVHVIDDFLILSHSKEKCHQDLMAFIELCERLGVPLAPSKTVGPSTTIPFLGIILDSVMQEARLPEDKIDKARALLLVFLGKRKVTLKELQGLTGFLGFACSVIKPGRPFLRRLFDLTVGIRKPHFHVRLTNQVKLDLEVWLKFLQDFNGKSFFLDEKFLTGDYLQLYTDAAGGIGYGALFGEGWFYGLWPVAWRSLNVSVLELYLIMAAVHVWGGSWSNQSVCFFTDNEALVPVINNQTSREPHIMALLRPLVLACQCAKKGITHLTVNNKRHNFGQFISILDSVLLLA